jgi:hypothetical protein
MFKAPVNKLVKSMHISSMKQGVHVPKKHACPPQSWLDKQVLPPMGLGTLGMPPPFPVPPPLVVQIPAEQRLPEPHWVSVLQGTHFCVERSQIRPIRAQSLSEVHVLLLAHALSLHVCPEGQSVFCKHCTQRPLSLSHTKFPHAPAVQPVLGAPHEPLDKHTSAAGHASSLRHCTHSLRARWQNIPAGQSFTCVHAVLETGFCASVGVDVGWLGVSTQPVLLQYCWAGQSLSERHTALGVEALLQLSPRHVLFPYLLPHPV